MFTGNMIVDDFSRTCCGLFSFPLTEYMLLSLNILKYLWWKTVNVPNTCHTVLAKFIPLWFHDALG